MYANYDILDSVQKQVFGFEKICNDIGSLNENFDNNDELILYLNIRSLNANFLNLEVFIESLVSKPFYIVCAETWQMEHSKFFCLQGYKMYLNARVI